MILRQWKQKKIFGALQNGVQEYVIKSVLSQNPGYIKELATNLVVNKGKNPIHYSLKKFKVDHFLPEVIVIGASTGSPEALCHFLKRLAKPVPPIAVLQHISYEFAEAFAKRLAGVSDLSYGEISDSTPLQKNTIYLSNGDYHLSFFKKNESLFLKKDFEAKIHGHRPSVDRLFQILAHMNVSSISILLTGMGQDGADGITALSKGGKTFAMVQDEESSVIFGMPKKAIEMGGVHFVGNLDQIRQKLNSLMIGQGFSKASI